MTKDVLISKALEIDAALRELEKRYEDDHAKWLVEQAVIAMTSEGK